MHQTVIEVSADTTVAQVLASLDADADADVVAVRLDGPDGPLWHVQSVSQVRARLSVLLATAVGVADRAVGDVLDTGPPVRTTRGTDRPTRSPVLVLEDDVAVAWVPDGFDRGAPASRPDDVAPASGPDDRGETGTDRRGPSPGGPVAAGPTTTRGGRGADRQAGSGGSVARGADGSADDVHPPGPRRRGGLFDRHATGAAAGRPRRGRPRRSAPPPDATPPRAGPVPPPTPPPPPPPPAARPHAHDDHTQGDGGTGEGPLGGRADRIAHARVDAPERAAPDTDVDVLVGLATEQQTGVAGTPMTLPAPGRPGEPIRLTIQVAGDGLRFPDGIRRRLDVDPDDLDAATTSFLVTTPAVDEPTFAMIQVDYAVDDQPVGRAWRQVLVEPPDAPAAPGTPAPRAGQSPVQLDPRAPVDLTITILLGDEPDTLLWLFATPHDVPLPDEQVTTRLPAAGARDFSLQQIARVDQSSSALVEQRLRGISRAISGAVPAEAWQVLRAVWQAVARRTDGPATPGVLIATSEEWVPWELASVEERFLVDATLVDRTAPLTLGCQVRLGRWLPPGPRRPEGVVHPEHPPPDELDLTVMAVVVGRYGDPLDNLAELPEARAEGDELARRYPSVRLDARLEDVLSLLGDRFELPDGLTGPVDVIHIACHGKIDPVDPLRNGIVLDDDVARLDELTVRGGTLDRGRPLVFVNACQLATTSTELLGDQGGLAAAFLSIGARGYIAPLWSVEDTVARRVATELHRLCLEEGVAVGEAMRRVRGRFADDPTSSTPLAYVYYGHPALTLTSRGDR